jgi:hypothetical protein
VCLWTAVVEGFAAISGSETNICDQYVFDESRATVLKVRMVLSGFHRSDTGDIFSLCISWNVDVKEAVDGTRECKLPI